MLRAIAGIFSPDKGSIDFNKNTTSYLDNLNSITQDYPKSNAAKEAQTVLQGIK